MENNSLANIEDKLMYFHLYLGKERIKQQLRLLSKFKEFDDYYSEYTKIKEIYIKVAKTLVKGLEKNKISEQDIDDLLFLQIEDSLFNSFIFHLDSSSFTENSFNENILNKWKIPIVNNILSNIENPKLESDFSICGYRLISNIKGEKISSIKLLLLDKELVNIKEKNKDNKLAAYPTIIELDYERKLLHIRLRDVDNIESSMEKIGTMKGRINNTLKFIDTFNPPIKHSPIVNFRDTMFLIEENILKPKRDLVHKKIEILNEEINDFTKIVIEKLKPPIISTLTPRDYISNAVLSIASKTIKFSDKGDIVGIRFRNTREAQNKYAEISIKDTGYNCISSDDLYWVNLLILLEQKKVEFLKIAKQFTSGFVIMTLDFNLDTMNLRLLQRSDHPDKELDRQPNEQKYSEVINYLNTFIKR